MSRKSREGPGAGPGLAGAGLRLWPRVPATPPIEASPAWGGFGKHRGVWRFPSFFLWVFWIKSTSLEALPNRLDRGAKLFARIGSGDEKSLRRQGIPLACTARGQHPRGRRAQKQHSLKLREKISTRGVEPAFRFSGASSEASVQQHKMARNSAEVQKPFGEFSP